MRISELSSRTGVTVATIKYYLREGLLPEGVRSSPTQATYDESHVERLRVIRALIESGVSVAESRKVLAALDNPPASAHDLLGAAHAAVVPPVEGDVDVAEAERLAERIGWQRGMCDEHVLAGVARALEGLDRAGFTVPDDVMAVYLDSVTADRPRRDRRGADGLVRGRGPLRRARLRAGRAASSLPAPRGRADRLGRAVRQIRGQRFIRRGVTARRCRSLGRMPRGRSTFAA